MLSLRLPVCAIQEHDTGYVSSVVGHDGDAVNDDGSEHGGRLVELNQGDIPFTGRAVASSKCNTDFHEPFKTPLEFCSWPVQSIVQAPAGLYLSA